MTDKKPIETLDCGCRKMPEPAAPDGWYWSRCKECRKHYYDCWAALLKEIDEACQNVTGEDRILIHVSRIEDASRLAVVMDSPGSATIIEQDVEREPDESCADKMFLIGDEVETLREALNARRWA